MRIVKDLVKDELARTTNKYDGLKVKFNHLYLVARGFFYHLLILFSFQPCCLKVIDVSVLVSR